VRRALASVLTVLAAGCAAGEDGQTRVTLDNVARVLEAAGTSLEHVVKVGVFLRDMKDFDVFNRVFRDYFKGVQPARTTVEASAPRAGVNVEIDAIAWIPR
jgi:2-iminobutanoate/2-iminopropanoate deaminase